MKNTLTLSPKNTTGNQWAKYLSAPASCLIEMVVAWYHGDQGEANGGTQPVNQTYNPQLVLLCIRLFMAPMVFQRTKGQPYVLGLHESQPQKLTTGQKRIPPAAPGFRWKKISVFVYGFLIDFCYNKTTIVIIAL